MGYCLPGVGLRCLAAWAGQDLVEPGERLVVELDLDRPHRAVELSRRARADDRRRHRGLVQQPRERDVRRVLAEFVAERLVGFDGRTVRLERVVRATTLAAVAVLLAQDAAEQTTLQRAPRDDAEPVVVRCRENLEFDRAGREVVQRLLADEAEVVAAPAASCAFAMCQPAKFDEPA